MAVIDPIGPYSRPHSLAKVDGRTRLAKLMRKTRAALTAHVGGDPSTTQRALIERVVWLTVKCCQNEAKILAGKDTEYDGKSYLAWSNALRRAVAGPWDAAEHTTVSNPCRRVENGTGCMIDAPSPLAFFDKLRWLDHRPLLDTIEPYRRNIFEGVLYTFDGVRPRYNLAVCGRAKKNWKTSDLILAALYRLLVWPSPQGNDCFILANDEGQAADDLDLAKKLVTVAAFEAGRDGFGCSRASKRTALVSSLDSLLEGNGFEPPVPLQTARSDFQNLGLLSK